MTDVTKPLHELAKKWKDAAPHNHELIEVVVNTCARELKAAIPQVEAAFDLLVSSPPASMSYKGGLVPINSEGMRQVVDDAARLRSEIAALKEPMGCGHPKACDKPGPDIVKAMNPQNVKRTTYCAACSRERESVQIAEELGRDNARLERAAALRLVAEELHKRGHDRAMLIVEELIPTIDQSALDARDFKTRADYLKQVIIAIKQVPHTSGNPEFDKALAALIEKRVAAALNVINKIAEADMLAGNPVTGAHHRAIEKYRAELNRPQKG